MCKGFTCVEDFSNVCNLLDQCNSDKNQGVCENGVCSCKEGWTGASCSYPIFNLNTKNPEKVANVTSNNSVFFLLDAHSFCGSINVEACPLDLAITYSSEENVNSLGIYVYASDPSLSKLDPHCSVSKILLKESSFSFQFLNNVVYFVQINNPSLFDGVEFKLSIVKRSPSKYIILLPIFIFFVFVIGFVLYFLRCGKKNPYQKEMQYENVLLNEEN